MPAAAPAPTMGAMQTVIAPLPPQTAGPGHAVAELRLPGLRCHLHTLDPGATAHWEAGPDTPLLLLVEGIGKAVLDGASQRVTAPSALCVAAGSTLRLTNQGTTPMRLLALRPGRAPSPAD